MQLRGLSGAEVAWALWPCASQRDHVLVKKHSVAFANLPPAFDKFTILHISDLHADTSVNAMQHLVSVIGGLQYDICVLTGDYRGKTYGPFEKSLELIEKMRAQLKGPIYGVLGNHDSIQMVPSLEAMGIRMLFNESEAIFRGGQRIFLARRHRAHLSGTR